MHQSSYGLRFLQNTHMKTWKIFAAVDTTAEKKLTFYPMSQFDSFIWSHVPGHLAYLSNYPNREGNICLFRCCLMLPHVYMLTVSVCSLVLNRCFTVDSSELPAATKMMKHKQLISIRNRNVLDHGTKTMSRKRLKLSLELNNSFCSVLICHYKCTVCKYIMQLLCRSYVHLASIVGSSN